MAAVSGQDSNLSSVRYAVETSQGTLPVTPTWKLTEPNTEPQLGAQLETVERSFITEDRMSRKGSVVDVNPRVQLEQDFTLDNQMELLQSFMAAVLRGKGQVTALSAVAAGDNEFQRASGLDIYAAGDLVFARGFTNAANNGLHLVVSAASGALEVSTTLVAETPPSTATITKVGHQYGSADVTVDASGGRPVLVTATGDFRELDLVHGESIYIGGDAAGNQFANAANNGCKRVYAVASDGGDMTLDKSQLDMVTDASATGKSIRIFTGFGLKNEQGASFLRQYVQFERTLGAPDDGSPSQVQSEYVTGTVGSEYAFDAPETGKITATMTFIGQNHETRTGATGVKSGNRPDLPQVDAVNTSTDIRRIRIAQIAGATDEAPSALFALVKNLSFSINNNINRGTALGVVGMARATWGRFACTGSFAAYFADVAALDAVRNYVDCTIDQFVATASNNGFSIDFPVVSLSSDGAVVEQDEPITMPCDFTAHSGNKYDATFDHAVFWTFFPYLPTLARTVA